VLGAEAQTVLLLAQRLAEHGHLGAHRGGDLHGDVAEPAHADDRDFHALACAPALQRRVSRDAGAQQRRGVLQIEAVGDLDDESVADDDLLAVAAECRLAVVLATVVRRHGVLRAELLLARLAVLALAAGVDEAADADAIAGGKLADGVAHIGDDPGDLVAGDHRKDRSAHSSLTWWMSEWQIPQNLMSISTSCSPRSRRSIVVVSNGRPPRER
jgi:hypothetical protein